MAKQERAAIRRQTTNRGRLVLKRVFKRRGKKKIRQKRGETRESGHEEANHKQGTSGFKEGF